MTATILWRRLDLPGHEIGILEPRKDGWELRGTAVFSHESRPCKLDYVVVCNSDWHTSSARVDGVVGDLGVALNVSVDERRRWSLNEVDCPAVAGCIDIDLGFSPSTNLLPIRRLSLAVGEEAEVRAAWLPFPSLVFQPLLQLYRRQGERTYRYESSGGRFVRVLEVSRDGLVVAYPDLWIGEALQEDKAPLDPLR